MCMTSSSKSMNGNNNDGDVKTVEAWHMDEVDREYAILSFWLVIQKLNQGIYKPLKHTV